MTMGNKGKATCQDMSAPKVMLKEGWTFIRPKSKMLQTKVSIVQPLDVTSHLYGLPNECL